MLLSRNIATNVKHLIQAEGRRKYTLHKGAACSKCRSAPPANKQRYCVPCHNAYMREWRKTHPLTAEQKKKDNARSYAGVYKKRGKLVKVPCESCGSPRSQMHHEDYDRPLDVIWLCRPCHMRLHAAEKYVVVQPPAAPAEEEAA